MADNADRAAEQTEMLNQYAIASRPRLQLRVDDGRDCLGCGERIPDDRWFALHGRCCLCVDCQDDAERAMGR